MRWHRPSQRRKLLRSLGWRSLGVVFAAHVCGGGLQVLSNGEADASGVETDLDSTACLPISLSALVQREISRGAAPKKFNEVVDTGRAILFIALLAGAKCFGGLAGQHLLDLDHVMLAS